MAIKEFKITRWDGGMADEERDLPNGFFRYLENVVAGEQGRSIKQTPNTETVVNNKLIRSLTSVGGTVYGLGQDNPTNYDATIYSGASSGGATVAFTAVTSGTATDKNVVTEPLPLFEYYNGFFYFSSYANIGMYNSTAAIMTTSIATTPTGGLRGGCVWQGKIYGCNTSRNQVYELNTATNALTAKITIPSDQMIVDFIPYGNYLLIICTSTTTASKMYVWDGVTTTTFADIVDIGYGTVTGGEILDGSVYAVIGFPNKRGFRLKKWNGNRFITQVTYTGKKNNVSNLKYAEPVSLLKAYTGFLYFLVRMTRPNSEGVTASGSNSNYEMVMFRYGKKDETKQNALSVYKTMSFSPETTFDDELNDFVISDGYFTTQAEAPNDVVIAVVSEAASTMRLVITKTTSYAPTYSAQAGVVETAAITFGDSSIKKQLKGVSAQYVALESSGQVVVKYRNDESTAWVEIFTDNIANSISHEAVNIESTGANLPIFKEISFRVELTNGAELTGFKAIAEEEAGLLNK